MADYTLKIESEKIIKQMGEAKNSKKLFCPLMKILQMRHHDLDTSQAHRVLKELLN